MYIAIKLTGLAIHNIHNNRSMIMHLNDAHVRANIYFTTKDTNKEKSIDAADSKGRPIPKYQMHVFQRTPMSKL